MARLPRELTPKSASPQQISSLRKRVFTASKVKSIKEIEEESLSSFCRVVFCSLHILLLLCLDSRLCGAVIHHLIKVCAKLPRRIWGWGGADTDNAYEKVSEC